ncbi:MAG: universal stress protein [Pseudomonadota bacterium]
MYQNILVAVDGSDASVRAIDTAIELSKQFGAKLHMVHVVREMQVPSNIGRLEDVEKLQRHRHEALTAVGEQIVNQAKRKAQSSGVKEVEGDIATGDPANAIVKYAEKNKDDLIIMGSRGLGQVEGMLMGSVSRKVANTAKAACMVVR